MVTQNSSRTCEGKQVYFESEKIKFATAVDLIVCQKQVNFLFHSTPGHQFNNHVVSLPWTFMWTACSFKIICLGEGMQPGQPVTFLKTTAARKINTHEFRYAQ